MAKLTELLITWCDGQNVKGLQTPPAATIRELIDIYSGEQTETINSTVKSILDRCGIKSTPKGIGWLITI